MEATGCSEDCSKDGGGAGGPEYDGPEYDGAVGWSPQDGGGTAAGWPGPPGGGLAGPEPAAPSPPDEACGGLAGGGPAGGWPPVAWPSGGCSAIRKFLCS